MKDISCQVKMYSFYRQALTSAACFSVFLLIASRDMVEWYGLDVFLKWGVAAIVLVFLLSLLQQKLVNIRANKRTYSYDESNFYVNGIIYSPIKLLKVNSEICNGEYRIIIRRSFTSQLQSKLNTYGLNPLVFAKISEPESLLSALNSANDGMGIENKVKP